MKIKVNGEFICDFSGSVHDLICFRGLKPERVAALYNGEIVPRSEFEKIILQDGDMLEIVQFVGGG